MVKYAEHPHFLTAHTTAPNLLKHFKVVAGELKKPLWFYGCGLGIKECIKNANHIHPRCKGG